MKYLDKKSKVLVIVIIISLFISISSATYAYFEGSVEGNLNAKQNVIESGKLALDFTDGPKINFQNMGPGESITKTFSVKNSGTLTTSYDVYFSNVVNTFVDKNDLVYKITSQNGCQTLNETVIPSSTSSESKMINNCQIESGVTHNYTLTITFKETNFRQDDNMGKMFTSKISVNSFEVEPVYAILINGAKFNEDMKVLAGDQIDDQVLTDVAQYGDLVNFYEYKTYYSYKANINIKHIEVTKSAPSVNKVTKKVSDESSLKDIIMWFENNTIYIYTEADKIYFGNDASHAFDALEALEELDLSMFDTSNSYYFSNMFDDTPGLTSLNLGDNFDTSSAIMMDYFLDYSVKLETLNLGNKFDTSNVINMRMMFGGMTNLSSLDLGNKFNTSKVKDMYQMFAFMYKLTSLNLGDNFDTSNVETFDGMFQEAKALKTLDLGSKFSFESANNTNRMFKKMSELTTIYVGKNPTINSGISDDSMFSEDTKLKGGSNTSYSSANIGISRAKIDGGTSNPGYFTLKN